MDIPPLKSAAFHSPKGSTVSPKGSPKKKAPPIGRQRSSSLVNLIENVGDKGNSKRMEYNYTINFKVDDKVKLLKTEKLLEEKVIAAAVAAEIGSALLETNVVLEAEVNILREKVLQCQDIEEKALQLQRENKTLRTKVAALLVVILTMANNPGQKINMQELFHLK